LLPFVTAAAKVDFPPFLHVSITLSVGEPNVKNRADSDLSLRRT